MEIVIGLSNKCTPKTLNRLIDKISTYQNRLVSKMFLVSREPRDPYKAAELCKTPRILKHNCKTPLECFIFRRISDFLQNDPHTTSLDNRCKRVFYLDVKGTRRPKGAESFRSNLDRQVPGKASPRWILPVGPCVAGGHVSSSNGRLAPQLPLSHLALLLGGAMLSMR
jgi:hypothetical protein